MTHAIATHSPCTAYFAPSHSTMPLSRREIRTRAVKFAKQWAGSTDEEAAAKPF